MHAESIVTWLIGSPAYASPAFIHAEVGCRNPVNLAKADSYSVGATLYQILTGLAAWPTAEVADFADCSRHFRRRV